MKANEKRGAAMSESSLMPYYMFVSHFVQAYIAGNIQAILRKTWGGFFIMCVRA
jgi:hypothetical protein